MAALTWLLIPVIGAVVATLWAGWAGRRRERAGDLDSLAGYERFRRAMAKSYAEQPRTGEPDAGPAEEPTGVPTTRA